MTKIDGGRVEWASKDAVEKAWDGALEVLRVQGEDPDVLVKRAASNVAYWAEHPSQDFPDEEPDDEVEWGKKPYLKNAP